LNITIEHDVERTRSKNSAGFYKSVATYVINYEIRL